MQYRLPGGNSHIAFAMFLFTFTYAVKESLFPSLAAYEMSLPTVGIVVSDPIVQMQFPGIENRAVNLKHARLFTVFGEINDSSRLSPEESPN